LSDHEIEDALQAGASCARGLLLSGLIESATLRLMGRTAMVGANGNAARSAEKLRQRAPEMMQA
jgi:uncharacterized protein